MLYVGEEAYIWKVRSDDRCAKALAESGRALITDPAPPYKLTGRVRSSLAKDDGDGMAGLTLDKPVGRRGRLVDVGEEGEGGRVGNESDLRGHQTLDEEVVPLLTLISQGLGDERVQTHRIRSSDGIEVSPPRIPLQTIDPTQLEDRSDPSRRHRLDKCDHSIVKFVHRAVEHPSNLEGTAPARRESDTERGGGVQRAERLIEEEDGGCERGGGRIVAVGEVDGRRWHRVGLECERGNESERWS